MATGFLYYLPGIDKADHDVLNAHGLAYAFAEHKSNPTVNGVPNGPDGKAGAVILGIGCKDFRYVKDMQTWRKFFSHAHKKEVWVGYWNNDKPGPADLLRADAINGHKVRLADDRQWVVPLARALNQSDAGLQFSCMLPESIDWKDGQWVTGGVMPRYTKLWDIAQAFWDELRGTNPDNDGAARFEFQNAFDQAMFVLQVNYRISPFEVSLLQLFDQNAASSILQALIDWPTFMAILQKKTSDQTARDGSTSSAGPEA